MWFVVCVVYLYGHGLSGAPQYSYFRRRYSLDFFVAQARDLLTHLGLQNTVHAVVGFSMGTDLGVLRLEGGVIAARYACRYASLVSSVVLISAAGLLPKKPWGVSLLQRCGCCCSPLYLCVPCCLCRCCFDKNNFVRGLGINGSKGDWGLGGGFLCIQRYDREGAEATAGMAPEQEGGSTYRGGLIPVEGGVQEGDKGEGSASHLTATNGSRSSNQQNRKHASAGAAAAASASAAERAPAPVAAASAVVGSGGVACAPNAAGACTRNGSSSSSSNSPALMLWKRLTWQIFAKKGSISTFVGCVTHVPLWDGEPVYLQLGKQQTPCLVLWGGDDPVVGVDCCRRLCSLLPNHASVIFPGCHHLLLAERPHACIALILTFLDFPSCASSLDGGSTPLLGEKGGGPPTGSGAPPMVRAGPPYMPVWKFLLPFDGDGVYVHPRARCPPGKTPKEFLDELNYKPAFFVCFGGMREGRGGMPRAWRAHHREQMEAVINQRRRLTTPRNKGPQQHQQQQQEYVHPGDVFEERPCDKDEGIMVTPDAGQQYQPCMCA
ncbi:hypothetical protein ACSSS7_007256 [Eimeria intestinalis]